MRPKHRDYYPPMRQETAPDWGDPCLGQHCAGRERDHRHRLGRIPKHASLDGGNVVAVTHSTGSLTMDLR